MPSSPYAQTNIQLFNQLQREDYSEVEMDLVRSAYEVTIRLYTSQFQASGRSQIAHVVGTASILSSLHVPGAVVAAGLVHNIYQNGDFGSWRMGISNAKRKQIKQTLGEEVESYVYKFRTLRLNRGTLYVPPDDGDALDPIERYARLIELAERLDQYLNHTSVGQYRHVTRNAELMVELAKKLGFPTLACEMEGAFREPYPDEALLELSSQISKRPRLIVPESYRRRVRVACRQEIIRQSRYLRSTIGMRTRLGQLVRWFRGLFFPKQA